ncbi:MAG: ATP-dependent 6-phosphofructokinase [Deltaproteobacteria bacterium]|nr:MAG: ATP-dependent 6-phosphofructokinase [Deltaproteobacteria bacterium]
MRIGVLTSGGDAPGMNAAVRTIAVVGMARGHEVIGIQRGYVGLLKKETFTFRLPEIDGISRYGGTILGSARSKEFPTQEGQKRALQVLQELGLDGLVVIGGNGSLTGAHLLAQQSNVKVVGLPASIDNDIGHCGLSIGTDTAVNTIVDACDRIMDTARAHQRAFIVEVMGRQSGFLAMRAGIAAEADAILYGEKQRTEEETIEMMMNVLRRCFAPEREKTRALIIKAEGVAFSTTEMATKLEEKLQDEIPGTSIRATILGHVVRGGRPSALDRALAQRLAFASIMACERGLTDVMMSWEPPTRFGTPTDDPSVWIIPIADMLEDTQNMLNGTSPIIQKRVQLLNQVEHLLAF